MNRAITALFYHYNLSMFFGTERSGKDICSSPPKVESKYIYCNKLLDTRCFEHGFYFFGPPHSRRTCTLFLPVMAIPHCSFINVHYFAGAGECRKNLCGQWQYSRIDTGIGDSLGELLIGKVDARIGRSR